MSFNFVVDRIVKGRGYPGLAEHQAEPYTQAWREFDQHFPYTVPVALHDYCEQYGYPYQLWTIDQDFPDNSYYTIAFSVFHLQLDYVALLTDQVKELVRAGRLRILFYYHEGDNPTIINGCIRGYCIKHNLPVTGFVFISGQTAADKIENCAYFPSHELIYQTRNQSVPALPIPAHPRERDFTLLSRTHKAWRASVVADLRGRGLLDNSYWSYNTEITIDDWANNPIRLGDIFPFHVRKFVEDGPYRCDNLSSNDHNDHAQLVAEHFTNSYCSIVLETFFALPQTELASFLTEKTFKCLKHGHPFVIAGPPGSLSELRELGYRTFDHCIDNSYDLIIDPTQRWLAVAQTIEQLKTQDLPAWFEQCRPDLEHNQQVFLSSKYNRLNMLHDKLLHQLATA